MRTTAAGSLPGTDFRGAVAAMAEAFEELTPLPELPDRGIGSQLVGRTLGLVGDLGFDLQPAGWRLIPGSGAEHRRARAQWRSDLDDLEELLQGFTGALKVGVAGPWTLAALVERPTGDRLLADHGARRELAEALQAGVGDLLADLRRRLPEATLVLQVDEPLLVSVADGRVPTASGFSRHRRVLAPELAGALEPLAAGSYLHCCAEGDWLPAALSAGFAGVSIDTRLFRSVAALDRLGEWLASGNELIAGVVDTARAQLQSADELVTEALRLLRPLDLDPEPLLANLTLGTACGLAGWSIPDVGRQIEQLRAAAPLLAEQLTR